MGIQRVGEVDLVSASEKLRELEERGDARYAFVHALPQIVAVVEMLDDFTGYDWHATQHLTAPLEGWRALLAEDVEELKKLRRKAQDALAALDEELSTNSGAGQAIVRSDDNPRPGTL